MVLSTVVNGEGDRWNSQAFQNLITAAGETQRSFAKKMGVSHALISHYCTGKPIPEEFAIKAKQILIPLAETHSG